MAFENQQNMLDKTYKYDGLNVFIDQASLLYLDGVEVDYVESMEGAGFKFNNPNVKSTCGCGVPSACNQVPEAGPSRETGAKAFRRDAILSCRIKSLRAKNYKKLICIGLRILVRSEWPSTLHAPQIKSTEYNNN